MDKKIYKLLNVSLNSKLYYSNIGYIIVSCKGDYVYKIYNKELYYKKELYVYDLLKNVDINISNYKDLGKILNYYVLQLENIRKCNIRKNKLSDLDLKQVAQIISKIHNFKKKGKHLLLGDIHSSNFYEINNGNNIELGIFDFSSSRFGDIEEDICNIYIDLGIDKNLFSTFIDNYKFSINKAKVYKLAIYELKERIKNGMNLSIDKKKMYYKYILIIKNYLG